MAPHSRIQFSETFLSMNSRETPLVRDHHLSALSVSAAFLFSHVGGHVRALHLASVPLRCPLRTQVVRTGRHALKKRSQLLLWELSPCVGPSEASRGGTGLEVAEALRVPQTPGLSRQGLQSPPTDSALAGGDVTSTLTVFQEWLVPCGPSLSLAPSPRASVPQGPCRGRGCFTRADGLRPVQGGPGSGAHVCRADPSPARRPGRVRGRRCGRARARTSPCHASASGHRIRFPSTGVWGWAVLDGRASLGGRGHAGPELQAGAPVCSAVWGTPARLLSTPLAAAELQGALGVLVSGG